VRLVAVIFDEAHKLPDTARDMYGDQLIQTEIPNLVRYTVSGRGVLSNCGEQLLLENDRLFERLTQTIPQEKQENEKRYAAAFSPVNKLRLRSMIEHLRCQRRYKIVRKRRRNFVVFRRWGNRNQVLP